MFLVIAFLSNNDETTKTLLNKVKEYSFISQPFSTIFFSLSGFKRNVITKKLNPNLYEKAKSFVSKEKLGKKSINTNSRV